MMSSSTTGEKPKNTTDRVLIGSAALGIIFALIPLMSPEIFHALFGEKTNHAQTIKLGKVTSLKNDVRQKKQNDFTWIELQKEADIFVGDSIFNGDNSTSIIELSNGSKIDLEQNSMLSFSQINEIEVPNLSFGHFKLTVNGKMKIAINGEITEAEGKSAVIEIRVSDKKKSEIKLKSGTAAVSTHGQPKQQLDTKKVITLDEAPRLPQVQALRVAPPNFSISGEYFRRDELYDFYELVNLELRLRKERKQLVDFSPSIILEQMGLEMENETLHAEIASEASFTHVGWLGEIRKPDLKIQKSFLGKNYVRLSRDREIWGSSKTYTLTSEPLSIEAPSLRLQSSATIQLLQETGQILFKPSYNPQIISSAIIEISESENFDSTQTQVFVSKIEGFDFAITEAKTLFVRLRGMNQLGEITEYGPVTKIRIEKPAWPDSPRLAEKEIHLFDDEEKILEWQVRNAKTLLELIDVEGKKIISQTTKSQSYKISHLKPGQYQLQLFGSDQFGRKSKKISSIQIFVHKRMLAEIQKEEVKRSPATTKGESSFILSEVKPTYLNEHYRDSKFSLEGSAFTVYSQQQVNRNQENPTALTVGIHGIRWWDHLGFEAIFKSKITTLSSSADGDIAPIQAEARIHKRWNVGFSPFSNLGNSQISIFSGFEFYRNSASGPFSPKYDLMKFGTSMLFPVGRRFDAGGEFVYGQGFEQSQKYEISGYLGYYFDSQISFGAGYRVHLFRAGSQSSSPQSLPYREGFGEGYSAMRWSY